ncbi:hypothetical protein FKG94_20580 [Exilibacterium tricleocarpae]|uniref:HEAT repeat domain-containing protein n=1 Tax=Exilibacterium tricleocarpae TaxID=2591008 RepID=A0A545T0H7_9GAMM|nr:hypothetical protein [Exilibacterium tricleocarpae]TQV70728.1 hypothetical protein FKG94_20580 [Exilibacterium tricleocarpae]
MSIKKAIAAWDGKSAQDIGAIYQSYGRAPSFIREVLLLLGGESSQQGASWLLKRFFEDGRELDAATVNKIYGLLPKLVDWQTKLHILQCIPYMPIEKRQAKRLQRFLQQCLTGDNKFVRAWAYNGFYELAVQHHEYEAQAREFFAMAMKDEAASVKARIRNLLKRGF